MIIILCEKYIHFIIIFYIKCIIYNHFWCVRPTKMSCFFFMIWSLFSKFIAITQAIGTIISERGKKFWLNLARPSRGPAHVQCLPDTDLQTLTNMLLPATVLSDYLASSSVDIPLLAKNKFNHLSISDDHYFFKPDRFVIIIQPWS